jgi:hypothetical protein
MALSKLYKKVDVYEDDGEDDAVDNAGYTGIFQRTSKDKLTVLSDADFLMIMMDKDKVKQLVQTVKSIDKCHTGFVTKTELDDIIKLLAPAIKNRDLNLIYRPFCAVQNRILVEYKKFFEWLLTSLK